MAKHPEKALSAIKVRNLTAPGRYTDGNGLYLTVDESGAKRWLLRTVIHGKRRDLGLGGLRLVSLAEAREEAVKLRKIARAGGDPLADRRLERRVVPTFEEAARQVHTARAATFKNPKHSAQWIGTLETYAFPTFGTHRVDHIDSADILKALGSIWTEKPETARRVRQRIRTVFDWARAAGLRSGDNPVEGVAEVLPRHKTEQKHHAALPFVDVPAFITALRASDSGASVKLAFEFLILTAGRTGEVIGIRWVEIDMDALTWIAPAERMKKKREHRVPLTPRCIEILDAAKQIADGGDYIFPGLPKKPLSNMAFNMALRRMKRTNVTPHGFRSSFRDWAEERTNFPRTVTEAALAHVVTDKTEAAYRRTDLFEKRRELMTLWARFATSTPAAKVVPIRA